MIDIKPVSNAKNSAARCIAAWPKRFAAADTSNNYRAQPVRGLWV